MTRKNLAMMELNSETAYTFSEAQAIMRSPATSFIKSKEINTPLPTVCTQTVPQFDEVVTCNMDVSSSSLFMATSQYHSRRFPRRNFMLSTQIPWHHNPEAPAMRSSI
jgi:hypothetical protein